jgi:DNA-binding response OmpR family regulator
MKVLLVDDDTTLLEVTAFALRRAGFLVILAYDAEQALHVWSAEQPDLLIIDIQLPGKDGLTLCKEIRTISSVPIILLTVRNSDEDIVHGLEIGADDYLTKPFSPKQLIARARAVLRRSSTVPKQAQLVAGELVLDTAEQVVRTPYGTTRLTPLEFRPLPVDQPGSDCAHRLDPDPCLGLRRQRRPGAAQAAGLPCTAEDRGPRSTEAVYYHDPRYRL